MFKLRITDLTGSVMIHIIFIVVNINISEVFAINFYFYKRRLQGAMFHSIMYQSSPKFLFFVQTFFTKVFYCIETTCLLRMHGNG